MKRTIYNRENKNTVHGHNRSSSDFEQCNEFSKYAEEGTQLSYRKYGSSDICNIFSRAILY